MSNLSRLLERQLGHTAVEGIGFYSNTALFFPTHNCVTKSCLFQDISLEIPSVPAKLFQCNEFLVIVSMEMTYIPLILCILQTTSSPRSKCNLFQFALWTLVQLRSSSVPLYWVPRRYQIEPIFLSSGYHWYKISNCLNADSSSCFKKLVSASLLSPRCLLVPSSGMWYLVPAWYLAFECVFKEWMS